MKQRILLFTDNFPYGTGESFLEDEVERLANNFELVVFSTSKSAMLTRTLNPNVRVLHVNPDKTTIGWCEKLSIIADFLSHWESFVEIYNIFSAKELLIKRISNAIYCFGKSRRLYRYLKQEGLLTFEKKTILYFYWFSYKPIYFALKLSNHPNIKLVSRVHGYDLYNERHPLKRHPFRQYVDKALDNVFFVSQTGMSYYFKTFGITPTEKHQLMYLGTRRIEGKPIRSKPNDFVVVSCSNVIPLKRVELIIEALSLVDMPNRTITWIHFGDGPSMASISTLAHEKLDSQARLTYQLKGNVSHHELLNFYSQNIIDCFITLSSSEGLPVSIMEAMSYGIPVFSTDVGGIKEMLPRDYPYLFEPNVRPEIVAHALGQLSILPDEKRNQLSKALKEIWEHMFFEGSNTEKLMERLRQ